jgi:hypothetical protein
MVHHALHRQDVRVAVGDAGSISGNVTAITISYMHTLTAVLIPPVPICTRLQEPQQARPSKYSIHPRLNLLLRVGAWLARLSLQLPGRGTHKSNTRCCSAGCAATRPGAWLANRLQRPAHGCSPPPTHPHAPTHTRKPRTPGWRHSLNTCTASPIPKHARSRSAAFASAAPSPANAINLQIFTTSIQQALYRRMECIA